MYNTSCVAVNKLLLFLYIWHCDFIVSQKSLLLHGNDFRVLNLNEITRQRVVSMHSMTAVGRKICTVQLCWGECMVHSVKLGIMCTLWCVRWLLGKKGGGRGLPSTGWSGKKPTREVGGRVGGHMQGCKETVLYREVVNPVWAGYPTLHCVPSFRKGLSPWSRVGEIKMINCSTGKSTGSGALESNLSWFVHWKTHVHTKGKQPNYLPPLHLLEWPSRGWDLGDYTQ